MLCPAGRSLRLTKNRIQECHQFGRSQDSPHSDTAGAPGLDHCSPGQVPTAVSGGRLPGRGPARRVRVLSPRSCALSQPDGIRAQGAPKLAGTGQVPPIAGAEGEVLGFAGEARASAQDRALGSARGGGEAIVRIGPRVRLLGVGSSLRDALRQLREMMAAALADGGERHRVPGEAQSDFAGLAEPVPTADRANGQH
jgi:hypothetical protein